MKTETRRKLCISCIAIVFCIFILVIAERAGVVSLGGTAGQIGGEDLKQVLKDGSYVPDKFGFSGGTGRVTLKCPEVSVRDGQTYASLVFDSGFYSYVKVGGKSYDGVNTEDTSTFEIPVKLNQNNTIVGCTTKMSAAHEIKYRIFVYIEEAAGGAEDSSPDSRQPSEAVNEDAPKIAGLTFKGKSEAENAEYFKIFHYEGGITCIEVNLGIDTLGVNTDERQAGEGQEAEIAALYGEETLRYLVAPYDVEIPAGLEKEMVVIRRPGGEKGEEKFHAYVASKPVLRWMEDQGELGNLALAGIRKEECQAENVKRFFEEGKVIFGGVYDDVEYKLLVREQCDLAVMPAEIIIAEDGEDLSKEKRERYMETAGYYRELDIPMFVDLSSRERTREGQEEWSQVYEVIFGGKDVDFNSRKEAPKIGGLTCESILEPEYAGNFHIYYYNDGFKVIDVEDSLTYLVAPDGARIPDNLPKEMIVLQSPPERIYVAGTATMAMFHALDGLSAVRFSALRADDWYVDAARKAMEAGEIKFAGKYSEPDYEMLVDEGCDLAMESQMIHHTPKVLEMLQMMDIPVFIDCSSNEDHPLGRVEWIKVYGALLNREEEAEAFFKEQTKALDELEGNVNTGKSVVYFYINSGGQAVVRTGTDYIAKMIEIAGGRYPFDNLKDKGGTAAVTMEEFYAAAADADYLIYNASIDTELSSIKDLVAKDEILEDVKAVKEGNVFCTNKDFYQAADIASRMITDIHIMLTGGDEDGMTFLYRVKE